jgi:hypothetical protein
MGPTPSLSFTALAAAPRVIRWRSRALLFATVFMALPGAAQGQMGPDAEFAMGEALDWVHDDQRDAAPDNSSTCQRFWLRVVG